MVAGRRSACPPACATTETTPGSACTGLFWTAVGWRWRCRSCSTPAAGGGRGGWRVAGRGDATPPRPPVPRLVSGTRPPHGFFRRGGGGGGGAFGFFGPAPGV